MKVLLRCDGRRPCAWTARAAAAVAGEGHAVAVDWVDTEPAVPAGLDSLFTLERMLLQRPGARALEPLDGVERAALAQPVGQPDVVIDMAATPLPAAIPGARTLRPLFNGTAGEPAALAAILSGDLPVIEIMDVAAERIVDRGQPSAEMAVGLSGSLETVMLRAAAMARAAMAGPSRLPLTPARPMQAPAPRSAAAFVARGLAEAVAKAIYRLCCYAPQWHVGWRFNDGPGVWERLDLGGPAWRRLGERPHCFNADPFPVTWNGRTVVFFEELDHHTQKGIIAAVAFDDAGPTGGIFPVLEQATHLSYPFVFEDDGQLWMIPETSTRRTVELYRCAAFPARWEHHATLMAGAALADATVVRDGGLYYLFGVTHDDGGGPSDTLAIFWAETLTGPWRPHAMNPVLVDRAAARPAGHFTRRDGRLWRPVQDCSRGYGAALGLAEVVELTPSRFRQETRRTIGPSAIWPGRKLHTLNRWGRIEVIDGSRIQPKFAWSRAGATDAGASRTPSTAGVDDFAY